MCAALDASESGYYQYLKSCQRPNKDEVLSAAMQSIYDLHPCNDNYGVNRMQQALEQQNIRAGIRRIKRIMREKGWLHKPHRRPHGLTKVDPETQKNENLLKQNFHSDIPYKVLLTDITQIQCYDGKLYISPILDCYNGEILALQMDDNMKKELVMRTVEEAYKRYPIRNAILHSDRGSQYTSDGFRCLLKDMNIQQSMSGVDHCYDNARMESFFATLKKELLYRLPTHQMKREEVKTIVFRYVFVYYNQMRVYTANPGGWPPAVYRRMNELAAA